MKRSLPLFALAFLPLILPAQNPCEELQAGFSWMAQGNGVQFSNATSGTGFQTSWSWTFGDGSSSTDPQPFHEYDAPGTYWVCLQAVSIFEQNGGGLITCVDSTCAEVSVGGVDPCDGLEACFTSAPWLNAYQYLFTNCTSSPNPDNTDYEWNFGDGTSGTETSPDHTYPGPGTYTVCLWAFTDDCIDSTCTTVVVGEGGGDCDSTFNAEFEWDDLGSGNVLFNGFTNMLATWHWWSFGDGETGAGDPADHHYDAPGEYYVCYTAGYYNQQTQDTCFTSHCQWIEVGGGDSPCDDLTAEFTAYVTGLAANFQNAVVNNTWSYQWFFGDGTEGYGPNPFHVFPEPGDYYVCLLVGAYDPLTQDSCFEDHCAWVHVGENTPCDTLFSAGFQWSNPTDGVINFYGYSNPAASGYLWYFGDGTTAYGMNVTHTYPEPGEYHVCLAAWYWNENSQDTCWAEYCQWINVEGGGSPCDSLNACFTPSQIGVLQVIFNNCSSPLDQDLEFAWTFGDGGTSDDLSPTHIYDEPGTYLVCLTVYWGNDCVDEFCSEVVVQGGGDPCDFFSAGFQWVDQFNGTISFYGTTTPPATGYIWYFGDGSTGDGMNTQHAYDEPGEYNVCLVAWYWNENSQDTCWAEFCDQIFVSGGGEPCDSLNACFVPSQIAPLQVFFNNCSSGPDQDLEYAWTFGDGGTSDDLSPTHTYDEPGTYLVCLTVFWGNDCVDEFCTEVVVLGDGDPCAFFSAGFQWTDQFNGTVNFYGTTTPPATGYIWYFGDGTMGDGMNTQHPYAEPGEYNVCLVAWYWNENNQDTCWAEFCDQIYVSGGGGPCDSLQAYFVWEPAGQGLIYFQDASFTNGQDIGWSWSFGDGTFSDDENPAHTFPGPGEYEVCLTIYLVNAPDSCSSTTCQLITIPGGDSPCDELNAEFSVSIAGSTAAFQAGVNPPGTSYEWLFGDGNSGTGANTTHTYLEPGTYNACLIVGAYDPLTQDSCFEDHCMLINVGGGSSPCDSLWSASFEIGGEGNTYTFYNTSNTDGTPVETHWDFGDDTFGDGSQIVHTYGYSGVFVVCMTITGVIPGTSDTCSITVCQTIEVAVGLHGSAAAVALNAWPQPFEDLLQLEATSLSGAVRYTLFDMAGRVVDDRSQLSSGRVTLDYGAVPPGSYVLRVQGAAIHASVQVLKR